MSDSIKDRLSEIYSALVTNKVIDKLTIDAKGQHRIKYYDYPETSDRTKAFIIIEPVGPMQTGNSGSDIDLQLEFTIQISCESPVRTEVKELQHEIKEEMKKLNFGQLSDGLDVYFQDTAHYVDARRYRGNTDLYDTNY